MRSITPVAALIIPFLAACSAPLVESVPLFDEVKSDVLQAPVDVVRDQQGIPHFYGERLQDLAFAQGYTMAQDRLVQMDLARRQATGTLAELAGDLSASVIDSDIRFRVHHIRRTADETLALMRNSGDPDDQLMVEVMESFSAGINLYAKDLQDNRYSLPPALAFVYNPQTFKQWEPSDTLAIGILLTFNLSYDADSEIRRTAIEVTAKTRFDMGGDPAHTGRRGIGSDFTSLEPVDRTYTLPGGTSAIPPALGPTSVPAVELALLQATLPNTAGIGLDRRHDATAGSNNWVIGPSLTESGKPIVANDPHLGLTNPATFYFNHLVVRGGDAPLEVQGVQFPGAPGVILGFNPRVAWGATVSGLDVTDVYEEIIVACGAQPCVSFKGQMVPLVPRVETIKVGRFGDILRQVQVTLYDVPHHGPILPRITSTHGTEALGSKEMSVRWTGHEPAFLLRAVLGLNRARSVAEAADALVKFFGVGGQNWVLGDADGHFGWTEAVRVPKRPAGTMPWKVLPGDGSAEWNGDVDQRWIPHAFDPAAGFLATANADPIGITDDGDPWESTPDGPLYLGADFDPGTRVGRITKRINALAGKKITPNDLQSIQGDVVSEWIEKLTPTLLDAAHALDDEMKSAGSHPELTTIVSLASPASKALVQRVIDEMSKWDFSLDDNSVAATLGSVWVNRFALNTFEDELDVLGMGVGDNAQLKLLVKMCSEPQKLVTGPSASGDPILFDDMNTAGLEESKRQVAAKALFDMLDYLIPALGADASTWTWGRLHTLTFGGLLPIDALQIPLKNDATFPSGFPRHGGNGTVDVGPHGLDTTDFSYSHGPNLRGVYSLGDNGTTARNVLPGGEVMDPQSPHYRDLLELWRKNRTFDVLTRESDVVDAALAEIAANGGGRIRFRRP